MISDNFAPSSPLIDWTQLRIPWFDEKDKEEDDALRNVGTKTPRVVSLLHGGMADRVQRC